MRFLKMHIHAIMRMGMLLALMFAMTFAQGQSMDQKVMKTKQEMKEMYGTVPMFFDVFPEHALPGVWEYFKQLNSPKGNIPPKYRELMSLAVASQIPCDYCVYFHTAAAQTYGASEAEIRESIAHSAATRQWSTILQGNQVEMPAFKEEVDMLFEAMAEKPDN